MKNQINDSYCLTIPFSASESYGLGMELTETCSSIFSTLLEQCSCENTGEIIEKFLYQSRNELELLNKLQKYELNCECQRFYESGGMISEADDLRNRLKTTGYTFNPDLKKLHEGIQSMQEAVQRSVHAVDLNNSYTVFLFCINLRENLAELLESMAGHYPVDYSPRAFKNMVELLDSGNIALNNYYNWLQAREKNHKLFQAVAV